MHGRKELKCIQIHRISSKGVHVNQYGCSSGGYLITNNSCSFDCTCSQAHVI